LVQQKLSVDGGTNNVLFAISIGGVRHMNHFTTTSLLVGMALLLLPLQAQASVPTNGSVPEPLSLALLATGIAGLGAAELIRRRKNK
jgi:hypothetical protein